MGKHSHSGDECIIEFIGKHIIDEGLIDLDLINGKFLQIIE